MGRPTVAGRVQSSNQRQRRHAVVKTTLEVVVSSMIREILLDEMSHVGLVGNMLSAIGDTPKLCDEQGKERVPKYPCKLPGNVRPGLVVRLTGLTRGSLDADCNGSCGSGLVEVSVAKRYMRVPNKLVAAIAGQIGDLSGPALSMLRQTSKMGPA
jgi:hypothetical protein